MLEGVPTSIAPGFYGKLPSRGDFVARRLGADFVRVWDDWLQGGMAVSQAALGEAWLGVYLTSPIWRFALSPRVCGGDAYVGVLIPSVDRVGRYFPLVAAASCGRNRAVLAFAAQLDDWYDDVENVLLATLAETPLDVDELDDRLSRLLLVLPASDLEAGAEARAGDRNLPVHCRVARGDRPGDALLTPLARVLAGELGAYAAWWSQGSERIDPCVLLDAELPRADAFVAMLDGRWRERGWTSSALERQAPKAARGEPWALCSAAMTDAGKARATNEDACARRDVPAAYIVADGLGGHHSGETASRMVARVLELAGAAHGLDVRVEQLAVALRAVNGCLRVLAEHDRAGGLSASTVAALLIDGDEWACVWAGDSRVYRLRHGALEQLSRDHADGGAPDDHSVTRAIGGADELELDVARGDVRAGDCYLLCTDGVHRMLAPDEMVAALSLPDPEQACAALKRKVLDRNAPDNLTAVVVNVRVANGEGLRA